jgi:hypothetical protein
VCVCFLSYTYENISVLCTHTHKHTHTHTHTHKTDLAPFLWTPRSKLDEQIVAMHPLWAIYRTLNAERHFEFPSDFKLLPEHCVQLLDAMSQLQAGGDATKALMPETYFQKVADPTFNISMRDARDWEQQIKTSFCALDYLKQREVLDLIIKPCDEASNPKT